MTELNNIPEPYNNELPPAPGKGPVTMLRKLYNFLASKKLALTLLIAILVCCITGVTVVMGARAGELIFGTLWFNGLLVLLVVNVAFCFFPRMWGRKLTLISFGMILFHLSFVSILGGIVYNSLFYFHGTIRLTEGETLPSGRHESYDFVEKGRYFDFSKLKGETTLIKMHTDYKVNGSDKRAAYEIAVGEGSSKRQGIIYITNNLDCNGFTYLPSKEGFSLLIILYDKYGRELYGAHVPLQSLKQKDNSYLYSTGTKDGPSGFDFPNDAENPLFNLQLIYRPSKITERTGEVVFKIWSLLAPSGKDDKPLAEGKAKVNDMFSFELYRLSVREVRYWVGMTVRYDPGKPIVLTSLWVALIGVVITFIGRMRLKRKN